MKVCVNAICWLLVEAAIVWSGKTVVDVSLVFIIPFIFQLLVVLVL